MPADPFDIKLTIDPAGTPTEIGLMLVKPEKQPKQYLITEVDPPDQHLDWVQRDFRGGMVGDKPLRSETNQYASGENFLAEPQSGHLFSGPDFKEASTVGSANYATAGVVHRDPSAGHYGFIINNDDIWRSANTGVSFALSLNPGAVTPLSLASWGDYLLMGLSGAGYYYSTDDGDAGDGSDWTQRASATGDEQHRFIPAGDVLWGLKSPDSLRWTTDPSDSGEWSGETLVGEDVNDGFVGGFFIAQILIVVKHSGVYVIDDGGNVEKVVTGKNIRGACTDRTSRVFFYDIQDNVWMYDIFQGDLRNLNFGEAVPGNLDIGGNIGDGLAWADGKLFVAPSKAIYQWTEFYDNTGRLLAEGWESLYKDTNLAVTSGGVFPAYELLVGTRVTFPVYFGGSATATKMGFVRARSTGDWSDTSNIDYSAVDSVVISGVIDHEKPTTRKLYQFVEVDLDGVDLNARVAYSIDGGTWTNLGAANITTTGKTLVEFPAGSDGYTVQMRLTNDPVDNADYIEVKSWRIHATLQPSFRRLVKIAARIADGLTLRNSARHPQPGDTLRTNLQTARTTGARLQLQDYFGNDFDVVILAPFVEVPSRDEKASDTESEIQFAAVEYGVGTAT